MASTAGTCLMLNGAHPVLGRGDPPSTPATLCYFPSTAAPRALHGNGCPHGNRSAVLHRSPCQAVQVFEAWRPSPSILEHLRRDDHNSVAVIKGLRRDRPDGRIHAGERQRKQVVGKVKVYPSSLNITLQEAGLCAEDELAHVPRCAVRISWAESPFEDVLYPSRIATILLQHVRLSIASVLEKLIRELGCKQLRQVMLQLHPYLIVDMAGAIINWEIVLASSEPGAPRPN